jgi:hypothetical protein
MVGVCVGTLRASGHEDYLNYILGVNTFAHSFQSTSSALGLGLGLVQNATESGITLYSRTQEAYIDRSSLPKNTQCRDQKPRRPPSHKMALQDECLSPRSSSRSLQ